MVPWCELLALYVSGRSLLAVLATCAGVRAIALDAQGSVLSPPDSALLFFFFVLF